MNTQALERLKLLFESSDYEEQCDKLSQNAIRTAWATGIAPPFSVIPFWYQMLGEHPGRLIKKGQDKPAKGRYLLSYAPDNNIVISKEYCDFAKKEGGWIVADTFYFYDDREFIEYKYESGFEMQDKEDDSLEIEQIRLCIIDSGCAKFAYCYDGNQFDELEYVYLNGLISKIKTTSWLVDNPECAYIAADYSFVHHEKCFEINKIENNKTERVYQSEANSIA